MGGKSEERERRQKAGGGGSAVASAAVIPLLRGAAAGGCAKGRSVERKKEGKERERREKGSAWAAPQQLQQPVRTKEGDGGKKDKTTGAYFL